MNDHDIAPEDRLQLVLAQIKIDSEGALAGLGDLILVYANDARLPFLQGSVLAGLGRFTEAHAAMAKAVQIAPGYTVARFQLGLLELSSGDAAAARATWQPLQSLPSDNPLHVFTRGLDRMIDDDFPAAISLLEQGIALNTELPPMNRDMVLLIDRMREKTGTAPLPADEDGSGVHFLLRQFDLKDTKH